MGQTQSLAIPRVIPNNWKRLDLIVNKIKFHLGSKASPTFVGVTITGLTHSTLIGANASKALESVTVGTGLDYTRPNLTLSHLGIEALTDPGGDRILFWDDSETATKWLAVGNSIVITATTIDTIQDIQTTASPIFTGLTIVNTINEFSTDGTMGGNSDSAIPTEKATKLYTDTLRSDLASVSNAKGASLVGVEDSASLYTATNVETALAEVMDKVTPVTTTGNSITTPTGTVDAGDINSTTTIDDADSYDVSEVTGAPGFDIQITFTGITSGKEPNKVQLHISYDGSAGHTVDLEMWNYTGSPQWDVISADFLPDTGGVFAFYEIDIPGTVTDYVSGGEAKLRFNHSSSGNANHDVSIDFAALKHDLGSGAGVTEHGALSGLGDDDHLQYLLADGTRALAGAWDMGNQALTNVNIDSGVITGITDLAVADGGTGASNAGDARTNLGLGTGDSPTWTGATLYSSASVLRLRDIGATADATTVYVEFGGTDAGVWSRTGWVGDGSSGDTNISLWAEVGNLQLGDSSGIDVLTLSGGNAVFTGTVTGTSFITAGNIGVVADAALLQLAANTLTVNGTITLPLANKINFRDSDISISSPFDGTLDIGADISVDFFYDNADVGDAVDGQSVYINRRAAEGDDYIRLYIDKDRKGLIGFNGADDLLQLATTTITVNGKLRVEGADANQKIAEFVGDDASHNRICICGPIDADSQLSFMHGGSPVWSIGNNADNDAFTIRTGTGAFGTNDKFVILSDGNVSITGASPNVLSVTATGDANPVATITGGSNTVLSLINSGIVAYLKFSNATEADNFLGSDGTSLKFWTENTLRATINSTALTLAGNLIMPNGGTIGQAAGPLLTFDDTNDLLGITGCNVSIDIVSNSAITETLELLNTGTGLGTGSKLTFSTIDDEARAFIQSQYLDVAGHNLEFGVGGFDSDGSVKMILTSAGTLQLLETAAAYADVAAFGQLWVKNDAPNTLWFTDDGGTDHQLAYV